MTRTSVRLGALASGIAALAFAPSAFAGTGQTPLAHAPAPNHRISHSSSVNWAGYAVAASGARYTSVSSTWTQPSVDCGVTPSGWSSFWVGLDGDVSNTVEQTGTEADCSSGSPVYSAWYEMYPKFPVTYSDAIFAGDQLAASVTTDGRGSFSLTLTDATRHWTETSTARLKSAKLSSAEVIAEAPSSSGGVLPLADFGTVGFGSAKVNGATLTSTTPGLDPITMVTSSGTVKARPSSLGSGSFSVTWNHS